MTIYYLLIAFLVPFVISVLITPGVRWFAQRVGALDEPNERKVHKVPVPRLGGVAIYASFFVSVGLFKLLGDATFGSLISLGPDKGLLLTTAFVLVLALGIFDDLRSRTPAQKVFGQLLAATLIYLAGYRISNITNPLGGGLLNLGIFDYPATVLWVVGITNAFNLIDGLDGLAAGVAAIASFTICGVSFMTNETSTGLLVLVLAGSVLGFLPYNFNPARIFLGDSGSLFLGFALAVFSMQSSTKGSTALAILVPILSLGLPIMDTLLAMVRRLLGSLLPARVKSISFLRKLASMFLPDSAHIHHRLIARGLSHRKAVVVLYIISCAFGVGAFVITTGNKYEASLVVLALAVASIIGVRQLHYKELAVLRNGTLLPLYQMPIMTRSFFRGFLDLACIGLAYATAYLFAYHGQASLLLEQEFIRNAGIVSGLQLLVFYFSGLYKGSFRYTGLADALKILKAVALSVILAAIAFGLHPQGRSAFGFSIAVVDFYLLLSLLVASRFSFYVLDYLFRRENGNGGKAVVIYGAGANGLSTLKYLLDHDRLNLTPVGFLDDAPELEGKQLDGYPIFGGHWKIPKICRQYKVEEVIVSCKKLNPQVLLRLRIAAREQGIKLRKLQVDLVDFPLEAELAPTHLSALRLKKGAPTQAESEEEARVLKEALIQNTSSRNR